MRVYAPSWRDAKAATQMTKPYVLALCLGATGGSLLAQDLVSVVQTGSIPQSLAAPALAGLGFNLSADYGVTVYQVRYTMDDLTGATDTVSGLLSLPTGNDAENKQFPRLVSQHGTTVDKYAVPSAFSVNAIIQGDNPTDFSPLYATQGYVTIAPDYLNMGEDEEGFHPYVHAETEALAALRMLEALERDSLYASLVNEQLFVTGYSQGGHASMALHELLVEDDSSAGGEQITAAAHMSGPYSVSGVMRAEVILDSTDFLYLGFLPYTVLSYQAAYPALEQDLNEIFRPAYVGFIEAFRDGYETGAVGLDSLTRDLLFALGAQSIMETGDTLLYPYLLLQPEFETMLREDSLSDWRTALRDNDTYDFTNPTPTRLYYCEGDDQVNFRNTVVASDSLAARGAADTEAVRLDTDEEPLDHGACAEPAILASLDYFADFQRIDGIPIDTRESLPGEITWTLAGDALRIDVEGESPAYGLQVFDALGRELLNRPAYRSGEVVDVSGLPAGFAAARLTDEAGRSAAHALVLR